MTRLGLSAAVVAVCAGLNGYGTDQPIAPAVRYLGQAPPGLTPARFAPGIVSTATGWKDRQRLRSAPRRAGDGRADGTWETTTDADVFRVDMAVVERLRR